jgi:CDGSH-type Zn-finger protein
MSAKVFVKHRGPLVVQGDFKVVDADGVEFPLVPGARAALCRCGASACKPFCDGSHNRTGFGAETPASESEP